MILDGLLILLWIAIGALAIVGGLTLYVIAALQFGWWRR